MRSFSSPCSQKPFESSSLTLANEASRKSSESALFATPSTPAPVLAALTQSPASPVTTSTPTSGLIEACHLDPSINQLEVSIAAQTIHTTPSNSSLVQDLETKNAILNDQLNELRQQHKIILDPSVESDIRLMEYTNEMFVAKIPERGFNSTPPPITVEQAVQCEIPTTCQNQLCIENMELVQRLKTTIEVLEADLRCLRAEIKPYECRNEAAEWVVSNKKKAKQNTIQNGFDSGPPPGIDTQKIITKRSCKENSIKNRYISEKRCVTSQKKVIKSPYKKFTKLAHSTSEKIHQQRPQVHSINIESDSHGRHLSGLIKELVGDKTHVTGVVKPGAKILDVACDEPLAPGGCTVLIAGTNDLAAGDHKMLCRHLERIVSTKSVASQLVVATLPHRYDLSHDHPINKQTKLVNIHIKNLIAKFDRTDIVDFNLISRRLFTSHGMHLRMPGKRLFARLVLDSVGRLVSTTKSPTSARSPSVARPLTTTAEPTSATRVPTAVQYSTTQLSTTTSPFVSAIPSVLPISQAAPSPPEPVCLPWNNYAEAVKISPIHRHIKVGPSYNSTDSVHFLEKVVVKQGPPCHP